MKVYLKSDEEVELLREANLLIGRTLAELARNIRPGVTTRQLDVLAETFIRDNGAIPVFKGFPNPYGSEFPASICTSVNEQVIHGIPDDRPLQEGDIVSIDCGTKLNGFCGDSCYTFAVGEVSEEVRLLLKTTKEALYKGIEQAVAGRRIGDISYAVQQHCESRGYGVVREFVGHGVGHEMHEDPQVPNFGRRGNGVQLRDGLCIAIEPMITLGAKEVFLQSDRWGIVTRDKKPAAHYEHSVCVRKGKADILSSFDEIESVLNNL
ncbi:MAG: type I methionyl aminopeptidase [Bacteroidaceae bacterium]|nr:type I methionyl aminopeptidase [Bacteroidaceae bacterium]